MCNTAVHLVVSQKSLSLTKGRNSKMHRISIPGPSHGMTIACICVVSLSHPWKGSKFPPREIILSNQDVDHITNTLAGSSSIGWQQWHPIPVLLPGKSHGWRSLVGCSPWGHEESDMTERLHFHFSLSCTGEGNGNLLQCSCLENPRDGEAWWATVYGVAQSWTQLKPLSSSSSSSSNQYPCLENPMDRGACRLQPRYFSNCLNTISTQYPSDGVCKNVLPFIT